MASVVVVTVLELDASVVVNVLELDGVDLQKTSGQAPASPACLHHCWKAS